MNTNRCLPIFLVLLGFLSEIESRAQGTIYFNNHIPGTVDAPVTDLPWGCRPTGTNFWAQLYAGPVGTAAASLVPVGDPLPFRSGRAAGYIDTSTGADRIVPGVAGGALADIKVVAYWVPPGASPFGDIRQLFSRGESAKIQVALGGGFPPLPPVNLVGLQAFSIIRLGGTNPPLTDLIIAPAMVGSDATLDFTTYADSNAQLNAQQNYYFRSFFFTFLWQKRVGETTWSTIAEGSESTLVLPGITREMAGDYRVIASASCTTTTNVATLNVMTNRPRLTVAEGSAIDGTFVFTLTSDANLAYRIETSRDLVVWGPIQRITNFTGTATISVNGTTDNQASFYRAVIVP